MHPVESWFKDTGVSSLSGQVPNSQFIKRALMSSSTVISPSRRSAQSGTTRQSTQAIDDPIRLYLLQMGGIPLLDRDSEVESARRIELWRRRYRNELLGNDLVLRAAVRLLERVEAGTVRLYRTLEVSVTNTDEKKRLLQRLGPNLETLRRIISENQKLFR